MIKKVNADYQNDDHFSSSFTEGARERERGREREKGRELEDLSKNTGPLEALSLTSN